MLSTKWLYYFYLKQIGFKIHYFKQGKFTTIAYNYGPVNVLVSSYVNVTILNNKNVLLLLGVMCFEAIKMSFSVINEKGNTFTYRNVLESAPFLSADRG